MLENKKVLAPPWIAYPYIHRYSIGWRMGSGEAYMMKWSQWYDSLTEKEQKEYQMLFPEPVIWSGFWQDEDTCNYYENGDFIIPFWQENGAYKYCVEDLRQRYNRGDKLKYCMFWKPLATETGELAEGCLGQWWMSDFVSMTNTYCCMEQYMMAKKALVFGDEKVREEIMNCKDPRTLKALGRKVHGFEETVWNKVRYSIILNGNYLKFTQNDALREYLLSTGNDILVEASPLDAIWGIRMSANNEHATNPLKWNGKNLLGFALMEVRDEIRRVWKNAGLCEAVSE